MKYWLYKIDWRTRVTIVCGGYAARHQAELAMLQKLERMPPDDRPFFTFGIAEVTPEMIQVLEPLHRYEGKAATDANAI